MWGEEVKGLAIVVMAGCLALAGCGSPGLHIPRPKPPIIIRPMGRR
jgi:hypothetical protein